ncbi:MAG: hypothetical protein WA908_01475 [Pontixanthobacter sp.]
MATGRSEAEFWQATPATMDAVIRGDRERAQAQIERDVFAEYIFAQMHALAGIGKLEGLDVYLAAVRPKPKATPQAMLTRLKDFVRANGGTIDARLEKPKDGED